MWRELDIPAVYTIEASFFGPEATSLGADPHFTAEQLMGIGRNLCQALGVYLKMKTFPAGSPTHPLVQSEPASSVSQTIIATKAEVSSAPTRG